MARRTTKTAGDSPEIQASKLASEHGGPVALRGSLAGERGPADGHWHWRDEYLNADPTWWYRAGYVETAELAENLNLVVNGANLRWYGPATVWRFDPSLVPPATAAIEVTPPRWKTDPRFCACGERLLLIAEDRVTCERCRTGVSGPVAVWTAEGACKMDELDEWPELPPLGTDLELEPVKPLESAEPPPPTAEEAADWIWQQVAHLYDR